MTARPSVRLPARACLLPILLAAAPLVGQPVPGATPTGQTPAPGPTIQEAPAPGLFEVAMRARILADSAARAERNIERLGATGALGAELEGSARRHEEVRALLSSMVEMEFVRLERLSRIRDQALLEDGRLEALHDRLIDRLGQLGEIRARWAAHQRTWRAWRDELRGDPDFQEVAGDIQTALERIDAVVARASEAATTLLALQRRTEDLRSEIDQIGDVVAAIRAGRRQALLQRGEPLLLGAAHRVQLAEEGLGEWRPIAAIEPAAYPYFFRQHLGFLAFHVLLAVALALIARWLRRRVGQAGGGDGTGGDGEPGLPPPALDEAAAGEDAGVEPDLVGDAGAGVWGGLLDRPWTLGVFGSVAVAMQRITLAPPLWDVTLWVLFGVTASLLSFALFHTRALRWTVYLLAAFYPVLLVLEVVHLPVPVFRIGLAAVAAVAMPTFFVFGRRKARAAAAEGFTDPLRIWPLRVGGAMWGVVLLAVVLGYDALGRWVLHAAVTTAAVAFAVVLVFALVRAALPILVRRAEAGRQVRGVGLRVARQLVLVVRVVVAAGAALVLLDIWGIAESPVATWQRLVQAGFQLGPLEITVGRVIVAALILYVAFVLSGLGRAVVVAEVQRRQDGSMGLAESISRLLRYAMITLGVVLALGAMGVELQNFAIVAGALGIGVGFGLQNVVNNFASGLILLFERPVRVGDTVVVDDVWGTVQKIGLRSTVMVTFDQSEMIVPNADLVSEKVTNWTLSNPTARIIFPVGVAYGSPVKQVLSILVESALAHDEVLHEPPPDALFTGFGDSSLDFELRLWVGNIRRRLQVKSWVLTEVERRLGEAGIEIPFPQRDLHLRSADAAALARLSED